MIVKKLLGVIWWSVTPVNTVTPVNKRDKIKYDYPEFD